MSGIFKRRSFFLAFIKSDEFSIKIVHEKWCYFRNFIYWQDVKTKRRMINKYIPQSEKKRPCYQLAATEEEIWSDVIKTRKVGQKTTQWFVKCSCHRFKHERNVK